MANNLIEYQKFIDNAIEEFELPKAPAQLYEPINYFLTIGGKRMRPILTLMGSELFSGDYKRAKHASMAVELFHNFTLIHDDIMDAAPLRRGKETVHTKWSENIAILSGDTLLIEAYKQLTSYPPEILAKLIIVFNQTAIEVCEGQQMDMDYETSSNVTIEQYIQMIAFKTAVLLGCSLKMGAIIGGASETDAADLYQFGLNLGLAFQIQDDILDVYADINKFGKQVGGDILANKKTYLLLRALQDADATQKEKFQSLFSENNPELKISGVKLLYADLSIEQKATEKMNFYHDLAIQNLNHITLPKEKKQPLYDLADFLLSREH
jgi:geranylgeranyl diphosphate synthase type II